MAARQLRNFAAVNFRRIALQHHRNFSTSKSSSKLFDVWKYRISAFSAGLLSSVAVTEVFGSTWLRPNQVCVAASSQVDWFHNLCMLLRADLSLIQRLVAKQCLKSDLFDSLVFIIIACLKFGPRN